MWIRYDPPSTSTSFAYVRRRVNHPKNWCSRSDVSSIRVREQPHARRPEKRIGKINNNAASLLIAVKRPSSGPASSYDGRRHYSTYVRLNALTIRPYRRETIVWRTRVFRLRLRFITISYRCAIEEGFFFFLVLRSATIRPTRPKIEDTVIYHSSMRFTRIIAFHFQIGPSSSLLPSLITRGRKTIIEFSLDS